ncbi:MAG: hypothetical protein MKZ62_03865 [Acidimicrobiales bacterium]|nr:hypothetical protein [Acidimicrobiales bacterium]
MTEEPQYVKITPEPNEFERAVILKAFKQLWPKDEKPPISYKWRFSGRWWADKSNPRSVHRSWRN